MVTRIAGIALCTSLALACGGSGAHATGSATSSGTIKGAAFSPKDAISGTLTVNFCTATSCANNTTFAVIRLSSVAGLCTVQIDKAWLPDLQTLQIELATGTSGNVVPTSPGVFTVTESPASGQLSAGVGFTTTDANGDPNVAASASAASGSVTLTSVSAAGYEGSYDLTFPGGDHLTGSFKTGSCAGSFDAGGFLTCEK